MSHDLDGIFEHWNASWEDSKLTWDAPLNNYAFMN